MKLALFLSVVSAFTVFHLCKAGPLRHLEKRAAFYIANETACVVDNIVYSNGDPIPTDDPCEACRCRPPGFACVLKECKIKPGCRAVRHAGECCPEYICGCEHNGRFYQDGDEIKDPKNPCYQCFCQGSSIACAFVDCIYRDECDSVFVPGECCPQYINCTRDIPDRNLFLGGNVFPPVNLLPAFNDEAVLPEVSPADQAIELPEDPTNLKEPQDANDNTEKIVSPESNDSEDVASKIETEEPETFVTEAKISNTEVEEKVTEPSESAKEEKQDLPKDSEDKETVESNEETKIILNSESDINKDDVAESSESENLKLPTEAEKELPQTTVEDKLEETVNEAEITEKPSETESTSPEVAEKSQIRNSASENSKSLKLTDDDQSEKKDQHNVKPSTKTHVETIVELTSESTSAVPIDNSKESSTEEIKPQSEENVAEESQAKAQATSFYKSNAKIKSESAETVTIVVHVKESSKIPTETDFIAETVTPEPKTSVSEENLLKSNHEIDSSDKNKESSETEDNKSTNANFEIFPTTEQKIETEVTSKSPSSDQNSEDIQGRSDEADNIAMEAEENPVTEDKVPDSKSEDDLSIGTSTMGAVEIEKEVRTNEEITEENKADEPTSTVTKTDASRPITVEIVTDSTSSPKSEKSTTESENEKTEELTKEKEIKNEVVVEAAAPEIREDTAESEEKGEEITVVQPKEESIKEEKLTLAEKIESTTEKEVSPISEKDVQDSITTSIDEKPEVRTNDGTETEKTEEKTSTESDEEKPTEEKKSEGTTETQNQEIQQVIHTTLSDNQ